MKLLTSSSRWFISILPSLVNISDTGRKSPSVVEFGDCRNISRDSHSDSLSDVVYSLDAGVLLIDVEELHLHRNFAD